MNEKSKYLDECRKVIQIEADAIQKLLTRVDGGIVKALDIIYACSEKNGRVILSGMGKSGLVARKIAATLSSTGTPSLFLHPAEAIHGDVGVVDPSDVAMVISKSGRNDELALLLPAFKLLDIPVIGMLGDPHSPLAERCDAVIDVSVAEEACPLDLVPTASTTAALVMGDALAISLLHRRGFTEEDFALLHPGGTLGRRLLLKLDSIMHSGDNIPKVEESTPLKELIVEMTTKMLGATCVTNSANELLGMITDGDLRRLLERGGDLESITAADLMNCDPKTINADALATRAISIMEKHSITQLVIVDDNKQIAGIVHLHDLLKAGIT
ncbi:D-arabinose 5-phosphate isomerase [candidate division LCP-89 bacterium B3_LCP]|uniref:D-arabinose 5-phosphate isomerase n=1 Tax=candidate division LCP-89 bacterium B3_LCP TaxID=2012998 RepID=A0A532V3Q8_UNCL8|nr:MAG: D-arabinose 5-phosphate isomerase [candidate division LCP-89 bacterium B3_LCP]